jgi:hypothetical protein
MVEVSAENITLVTVITFLSAFFILCMFIPSGLVTGNNVQGRTVNVPSYFEAMDIQYFAQTYVVNLTDSSSLESYEFNFGGWNMKLEDWDYPDNFIWIRTQASWWVFRWDFNYFHWYDKEGIEQSEDRTFGIMGTFHGIAYSKLDDAYAKWGKDGLRWILKNTATEMVVYVGFNASQYANPSDALNNGALSLLLCMNMDKINTSFNAWNLIGSILFFQMPNVHPALNMIIAIPVWILIAWLIYILILKAIPFVGD